ncbi:porphobilinogen synthase [Ruficoccus amylovorans]|uniref:Delta-aminolevulinic acid dehydratase n=1 Tax=Ruficoccus amylovorans TaxID=1804625 RepID=A0A842HIB9_9BACT|nr:porphobilinogen synthase [Ruficoccus amylovorans]MBC2595314.1 porphobilinogen synthase [Ruficoccus amylovorans]
MRRLNLPRRPRRLRRTAAIRNMVAETRLTPADLIQPYFVIDGEGAPQEIASLPGQRRLPIRELVRECEQLHRLGVPGVALFPSIEPVLKDAAGSEALNPETLVLRAIRAVKQAVPELAIVTDIALDPYTDHGHDGIFNAAGTDMDNDGTVEILRQMSLLCAEAGADFVAPSDMMDGRIEAIRESLDDAGLTETAIMAYSAKFASAFYGPFRDAVGSASVAGTNLLGKHTYQLNPANRREALLETELDELEAADVLMVKPAGAYLDIIRDVRNNTHLPLAAYQVSGEYAQLHAAARLGWLDLERCRDESLLAIKRAGADMILTYFAAEVAGCFSR